MQKLMKSYVVTGCLKAQQLKLETLRACVNASLSMLLIPAER